MNETWQRFVIWCKAYERRLSSAALVGGFVLDNLTFRRIDQTLDLAILFSYIIIAVFLVIFLARTEGLEGHIDAVDKWHAPALFALQWVFGGLASASFIFYFRSGTIVSSWPFLLALVAMLIGNEVFRERYGKLIFRLVVFAFVLLSFVTLVLPVAVGQIGPLVFLAGVAICLALLWFCQRLLKRFVPELTGSVQNSAAMFVGITYLIIVLAYFANIIPPVPLALKEAQVAYSITRNGLGFGYNLELPPESWYERLAPGQNVEIIPGMTLYMYTAIFAPTRFDTQIVHVWQKKSLTSGDWETLTRIPYPISGGVSSGYRGYSQKSNVTEGKWRVNVETPRGQIIGRINFNLVEVTEDPRRILETR